MNNKMNQNPFEMFGKSPLAMKRTSTAVKLALIFIFGIIPMILIILLFGVNEIPGWRDDGIWTNVSYGALWGISIGMILLQSIVISLITKYSKNINIDVIPPTIGFSFLVFSFVIIPLTGYAQFAFILISPIFYIVGFVLGAIGTMIATIKKISTQIQTMQNNQELKNGMEDFINKSNQSKQNIDKEEKDKKYKDNPYVDLDPEEE